VSPSNPDEIYIGGNVIFKSTDGGAHWKPISPDLTRNDKSKQESSGGIELDLSGAETFDCVLSMSISATDSKIIWAGTDDGLIQVTQDGGDHWANVTPKGIPEWGRLQQIEASPFDPPPHTRPSTSTRSTMTDRSFSRLTTLARHGRRSMTVCRTTCPRA